MKKAICSTICVLSMGFVSMLPIAGCNGAHEEQSSTGTGSSLPNRQDPLSTSGASVTRSLQESLSGVSQDVITALGPHAEALKNLSADEVMKLFRWNYKVVELSPSLPASGLEDELNRLGKENWECFNIVSLPSGIRVTCKKRPMSAVNYLQYIPGM